MPSTEAYVGSPAQDPATGQWHLSLDEDAQASFDSTCELVSMVFDADVCMMYANFPQLPILLSRSGDYVPMSPVDQQTLQSTHTLCEAILDVSETQDRQQAASALTPYRHRVISPIILPSGLAFGWLVFSRPGDQKLSRKEKATLRVLQRDTANNLLLSKQLFENAKARGLQSLISEHNEDWIFVKDSQFRIVYANEAFLQIYPENMRDRIIGYTTVEEYDEDEANVFLEQDRIAFDKGISKVTEDLHMPDGRQRIVETVKRRFEDDNGKQYILAVCRNVTASEDLIRDLKKANEELGYFTSVASHDLKSPLNAIRRLLAWIEEDCAPLLPEEHIENMHLVVNRANRMQALLDDLLTYARIDREDVTVSEVNFAKMYQDIAQLLDVPDTFTVTVPDTTVIVPVVPFKTVMLNLIGNAIKHNDKAHGTVDLSIETKRHFYVIKVSDNGPGVEPKYFDKIFQLFQTLKPRDEVEGSGIGLSVVMKYVSGFGGRVEVISDGKTGTTFKISWPKGTR